MYYGKAHKIITVFIIFFISTNLLSQELDKRRLESGIAFLKEGKYKLALEDFNAIIKSSPDSPYADDAKLQIAKYYLEIEKNYEKANQELKALIDNYGATESAEAAYFYIGYINLITGESQEQYNEALANFERIARLFPQSQWVDNALLNSALTYERLRDYYRAIDKLNSLLEEYPQFEQASMARLLKAKYFSYLGNYEEAIEELQRLRNSYPDSSESVRALNILTLLYRLIIKPYVRKEPIYYYDARFNLKLTEKIKDAKAIVVDRQGRIFIADNKRNAILQFSAQGDYLKQFFLKEPRSIFLDSRDNITMCSKKVLLTGQKPFALFIKAKEGPKEVEEAVGIIKDRFGRCIVADKKTKKLLYFDQDINHLFSISNPFFKNFNSIAIDSHDHIWILEEGEKSLKQLDLQGEVLHTLSTKGRGYEFSKPVDIALDVCNNLYILDRKQKKVYIFSINHELLASFSLSEGGDSQPINPKLIAIDEAGGLYIFDDKSKSLLRYL